MTARAWMLRAGEAGRAAGTFLSAGRIGIAGAQPDSDFLSLDHSGLVAALERTHPGKRRGVVSNWARQYLLFRDVMETRDLVVIYRPDTRHYARGHVTSPAFFDPGFIRDHRAWGLARHVTWRATLPRDALPQGARADLDRRTTLHEIPRTTADLLETAGKPLT